MYSIGSTCSSIQYIKASFTSWVDHIQSLQLIILNFTIQETISSVFFHQFSCGCFFDRQNITSFIRWLWNIKFPNMSVLHAVYRFLNTFFESLILTLNGVVSQSKFNSKVFKLCITLKLNFFFLTSFILIGKRNETRRCCSGRSCRCSRGGAGRGKTGNIPIRRNIWRKYCY